MEVVRSALKNLSILTDGFNIRRQQNYYEMRQKIKSMML